MGENNYNGRNLPYKKPSEAFKDIEDILNGTHPVKYLYHTLPMSLAELETFEGYDNYTQNNVTAIELRREDIEKHFESIRYAIDMIKGDCLLANKVLDLLEKEFNSDYYGSKYDKKSKRLREKREVKYNIESDIKKFASR